MSTHFTPAAFKFLEGLARHNDRAWFEQRRSTYENELKQPTLELIAEINSGLEVFAPEFIRDPAKCMMRIYRDIRFSKNKSPYKTHVAAWWARKGMEKTSGAGFYLEIGPKAVRVAAGVYMPEKEQLLAIRRMLLDRHQEVRQALNVSGVKPPMPPFDGMKLTRCPKGFPPDHPADDLILQRQWGVMSSLEPSAALEPAFPKQILKRFRLAAPLVQLLNAPLIPAAKKPMF